MSIRVGKKRVPVQFGDLTEDAGIRTKPRFDGIEEIDPFPVELFHESNGILRSIYAIGGHDVGRKGFHQGVDVMQAVEGPGNARASIAFYKGPSNAQFHIHFLQDHACLFDRFDGWEQEDVMDTLPVAAHGGREYYLPFQYVSHFRIPVRGEYAVLYLVEAIPQSIEPLLLKTIAGPNDINTLQRHGPLDILEGDIADPSGIS